MNDSIIFKAIAACLCLICSSLSTKAQVSQFDSQSSVIGSQESFPRNSLNRWQSKIHRILNRRHDGEFANVTTHGELVVAMRQMDLPVFVDYSAMDDSWEESTLVRSFQSKLSNYETIELELSRVNATLAMIGDKLMIISLDVASDPDYFTRIVYEVPWINAPQSWEFELMSVIAADSWDDTNGDGFLMFRKRYGRNLLIVNQSYRVHREIQEYLRSLNRMRPGSVPLGSYANYSSDRLGSRVITVPDFDQRHESFNSRFPNYRQSGSVDHEGQKGGGLFAIPNQTD